MANGLRDTPLRTSGQLWRSISRIFSILRNPKIETVLGPDSKEFTGSLDSYRVGHTRVRFCFDYRGRRLIIERGLR